MSYMLFVGVAILSSIGLFMLENQKSRITILKREVKVLKNKVAGGSSMSKVLEGLIGMECDVYADSFVSAGLCTILETDDEWVKVSYTQKKKGVSLDMISLIRVEDIKSIQAHSPKLDSADVEDQSVIEIEK